MRHLTVESMDLLMAASGLTLLDLISPDELLAYLRAGRATDAWLDFQVNWMPASLDDRSYVREACS
jgi:hypothetical protein